MKNWKIFYVQVNKIKNMSRRGKELSYDIIEKFDDFELLHKYLNEQIENLLTNFAFFTG